MEPFKIAVFVNVCKRHIMNNVINNTSHTDSINNLEINKEKINIYKNKFMYFYTKDPANQNFSFKKKLLNMKNNLYPAKPTPRMQAKTMNIFQIDSLYSTFFLTIYTNSYENSSKEKVKHFY